MKTIEKIYYKNTINKLTVTPDRISMKFIDENQPKEIEEFFLKLSDEMKDVDCGWRGVYNEKRKSICMYTNNNSNSKTYCFEDFIN